jgi:hypothetical protein
MGGKSAKHLGSGPKDFGLVPSSNLKMPTLPEHVKAEGVFKIQTRNVEGSFVNGSGPFPVETLAGHGLL